MAETVKYIIEADISDFVRGMLASSTAAEAADKRTRKATQKTDKAVSSASKRMIRNLGSVAMNQRRSTVAVTSFQKAIQRAYTSVNKSTQITENKTVGMFSRFRNSFNSFDKTLDRSTDLVRDWNVAMRSVNTTTLVIGATTASGALLGLVAAASQAVGILYTLPAAAIGAGTILASLRVGFGGIGAAVKALDKANKAAAGSSGDLNKQLAGFDKMNVLNDQSAGAAAIADLNEAMDKLSPAGKAVALALYEIGQAFQENVMKPVQEVLLNGVAPALLYTYGIIEGPLRDSLSNVAGSLNLMLLEMLRVMSLPFFSSFIEKAGELGAYIVTALIPVIEPLARGIASLFEVTVPYIQLFVDGVAGAIIKWGEWMQTVEGRNAVREAIDDSIVALRVLGDLFGAVFGTIDAIFDAAGDAMYKPINAITEMIKRFETWLRTARGIDFVNDLLDITTNAIKSLSDALSIVGGAFADAINWFNSLDDSTQQTIIKVGIFIGAITGLVGYIGGLISPLVSFGSAIASFVGPLVSSAAAATGATGALGLLRGGLGLLLGPVGLIITALTLLYTGSEDFRNAINQLIGSAINVLISVFKILMSALEPVFKIFGLLVDIVGGVLASVISAFTPILKAVATVFELLFSILEPVFSIIGLLADVIGTVLKAVFEAIGPVVQDFLEMNMMPLSLLFEALIPVLQAVSGAVRVFSDWLSTTASNAMAMVGALGLGKSSTETLEDATKDVKDAQDKYNESVLKGIDLQKEIADLERSSVDAKLGVMDAQDRLKEKQDKYNEAIAKYGPNSREAERATLELESAQYKLDDAQTKVKETGEELKNKNIELQDQNKKTSQEAKNLADKNTALKVAQDGAKGSAEGLRGALGEAIKGGVNGIIRMWNNFSIPPVNILGKEVTPRIHFPDIPYLAKGGIVSSPTMAMVGEAGTEAVMPLENNTGWIDDLASKLNGRSGAPVNLTIQIGEEQIVDTVIDLINDKTNMTGQNVITV